MSFLRPRRFRSGCPFSRPSSFWLKDANQNDNLGQRFYSSTSTLPPHMGPGVSFCLVVLKENHEKNIAIMLVSSFFLRGGPHTSGRSLGGPPRGPCCQRRCPLRLGSLCAPPDIKRKTLEKLAKGVARRRHLQRCPRSFQAGLGP